MTYAEFIDPNRSGLGDILSMPLGIAVAMGIVGLILHLILKAIG